MSCKTDIADKLEAAVPGVNVVPVFNQAKSYPAVVFSFRNGQREVLYKGSLGLAETELTVNVFSTSYKEMVTLVAQIETAFHAFSGAVGGTFIQSCEVDNYFETFVDDGELYQGILQIKVLT